CVGFSSGLGSLSTVLVLYYGLVIEFLRLGCSPSMSPRDLDIGVQCISRPRYPNRVEDLDQHVIGLGLDAVEFYVCVELESWGLDQSRGLGWDQGADSNFGMEWDLESRI
uniref:Uncharacterized protein n=1 Tax=Cannabis sativa TaxID=3483 RepID=A0A803QRU5_CANSA